MKFVKIFGNLVRRQIKQMTERNFKKELSHSVYYDMEDGNDTETIDYDCLIGLLTELCGRIEQLEKDNELLKSYVWDGNGK
jgi:Ca2+-binding EF-hand superfamily protein